jgi:hypothetical protein
VREVSIILVFETRITEITVIRFSANVLIWLVLYNVSVLYKRNDQEGSVQKTHGAENPRFMLFWSVPEILNVEI